MASLSSALSEPVWRRLRPRPFDAFFAGLGLLLFAPLMLIVALFILLEDGRPVFFRQMRLGRFSTPFTVLKFRTMRGGRVTRGGRWLRATGLDELPQFLNVLMGDMAMVGPRPLTAEDVARLGWSRDRHALRFTVPPGITGLAQLFSGRSASYSARLDRLYIRCPSRKLDVWIIFLSFAVNILGKRRVRNFLRHVRSHSRSRHS